MSFDNYGNNNSSMSLGASLILIAIIGIPLLICNYEKTHGMNEHSGEKEFRIWAKDLNIDYKKVSCNSADSDGDGYVSCTYSDNANEIHQIECAGSLNWQHGCRIPKVKVNVRQ